jgi:hypothetical protein
MIFVAVSFCLYLYLSLTEGGIAWSDIQFSILGIAIIILLPSILLHINYIFHNSCRKFEVDFPNGKYIFHQKNEKQSVSFNNVISTKLVRTPTYKTRQFHLLKSPWPPPWMKYGFIEIETSEKTFYVTSLMISISNPPLPEYEDRYWLFPAIGMINK